MERHIFYYLFWVLLCLILTLIILLLYIFNFVEQVRIGYHSGLEEGCCYRPIIDC